MNDKKPQPEVIRKSEVWSMGKKIERTKDRVLYYFIYLTGARIGEALTVKKRDIREDNDVMIVRLLGEKNEVPREVPLIRGEDTYVERMMNELREYIHGVDGEEEHIFKYGDRDIRHARDLIYQRWRRNLKIRVRAESGGWYRGGRVERGEDYEFSIHPHYLRHCRTTHIQRQGLNVVDLAQYAGWKDWETAKEYVSQGGVDNLVKQLK